MVTYEPGKYLEVQKAMGNEKKIFSIYICTYNGEDTIRDCITHLLNLKDLNVYVQSVVVVDNNSNDNTKQIVLEMQKEHPIIQYEYEPQPGLAFARRHAAKSNAEWIIYVDDDNLLTDDWLVRLFHSIEKNPAAGMINGNIIAKPSDDYNESDWNCLKVLYRNLACTSLSDRDLCRDNKNPVGAGLCVRTAGLKEIDHSGWLHATGRKGNELLSGEDGELASRMIELGYTYLYNYGMKLYHVIPRERVQYDYVERLLKGLVIGSIQHINSLKNGKFKLFLRRCKYAIKKIQLGIKKEPENAGSIEWWKYSTDKIIAEAFVEYSKKC